MFILSKMVLSWEHMYVVGRTEFLFEKLFIALDTLRYGRDDTALQNEQVLVWAIDSITTVF